MWSKYYLSLAAADTGQLIFIAALMISSLLNVAYLIPIVARGFFRPREGGSRGIKEAPVFCVIPLCVSALGCIALFFFVDDLYNLLLPWSET